MKKLHLLFSILLLASSLSAQKNSIVISRPGLFGNNYEKNAGIPGNEYIFSDRIDEVLVTEEGITAVTLRGLSKNGKYLNNSGNFILYNFAEHRNIWERKVNFQRENVVYFGNRAFLIGQGTVTALDNNDGKELWTSKSQLYRVDPKKTVGITYKYSVMNPASEKMEGMNLETGQILWTRDLDRTFGWDEVKNLNDSVILISSSGLHTVNLNTGEGWDYKAQTGKKQTGEAVAKGMGSVVLGVLTGVVVTPNVDVITGLVSNTLIDNEIFLASADKISCLDKAGNIIWSNDLPKDKASSSSIFKQNDSLFHLNKGYAYENGKFRLYGSPYFSIYNVEDGTSIYTLNFEDKKLMLNDVKVNGDTLTMLFSDRIKQFSMAENRLIIEKIFDKSKTGYLYNFVNDDIFLENKDNFELAAPDSTNFLISTSVGSVIKLNRAMEIEQEWVKNQFFESVGDFSNQKMLYKDGSMVLIDNTGKRIADIQAGGEAKVVGNYLYETNDKVLKIIDLSNIINNN